MAKNRLEYETQGGNLSALDTFKQLLEYLRLFEEDMRSLGRLAKLRNDDSTALAYKAIAINFKKVQEIVSHLALAKAHPSSIGYTSNVKARPN